MARLTVRQLEQIKYLAIDNAGNPLNAVAIAKRMNLQPSTVRNRLKKYFNYKMKSKGYVDLEASQNIVDYTKKKRILVAPKTWIYVDDIATTEDIEKAKIRYNKNYDGVRGHKYNHKNN